MDGSAAAAAAHEPVEDVREVERRYRTLVSHLPLVIYVDALDEASSNIFTRTQIEPLLGYSVDEWQRDPDLFVRTLHPEDRERVLAAHTRTHRTHEPLSLEYGLVSRGGETVWVRDEGVVVLDEAGGPLYLQGYLLDITAQREAQAQLREQALFDPLTGLANRAFFHEQLEHAVSLRKVDDAQTALVYLDLDEFKAINDQHGHSGGDDPNGWARVQAQGKRRDRARRQQLPAAQAGRRRDVPREGAARLRLRVLRRRAGPRGAQPLQADRRASPGDRGEAADACIPTRRQPRPDAGSWRRSTPALATSGAR